MRYRSTQLFSNLVNQCHQVYFWPTCEFIGSTLIIAMLYALLVFDKYINGLFKLGLIVTILTVVSVACVPLLIGSQCLSISRNIIFNLKNYKCYGNKADNLNKYFLKSCAPISLKIGYFHEMDRTRVPSLIRFILQRTFFLVFKTKDVVLR